MAPVGMSVLPDAMEPGIHCARTRWIRGFMAFRLVRRTRTMMLVAPVWLMIDNRSQR